MYQNQRETPEKDESTVPQTQVWQLQPERYIEFLLYGHEPVWPDSYELVAYVQTDDLTTAFARTQDNLYVRSGVKLVAPYGGETVGVDASGVPRNCVTIPPRSTSVGDVLVTPDGNVHRVEPYSFAHIGNLH